MEFRFRSQYRTEDKYTIDTDFNFLDNYKSWQVFDFHYLDDNNTVIQQIYVWLTYSSKWQRNKDYLRVDLTWDD